jgi:hypothetical protein
MAGNLADLNNYFQNTLQIVELEARTALNNQGLTAIDDFISLTESDIEKIASNVRKPGGVIVNPNAAVAGQPGMIPNPGVTFGHLYEKRLKLLHYYVHHLVRVQRLPWVNANAPLARLIAVYRLKEQEDEEDDEIELPDKLSKVD